MTRKGHETCMFDTFDWLKTPFFFIEHHEIGTKIKKSETDFK